MLDWEKQAQDLLQNSTLSYKQIGERVGRSRDSVVKFCSEQKIKRPSNRMKGHVGWSQIPKLSPKHVALGLRITRYRNDVSVTELASRLGVSSYVLRMMEYGLHDFTLSQLMKLSEAMDMSLDKLTETYNDRRAP